MLLPLPRIYVLAAVILQLEPGAKVIHAAHWYVLRATRGIGFSLLFSATLYSIIYSGAIIVEIGKLVFLISYKPIGTRVMFHDFYGCAREHYTI